jgi:hypothetical protein
MPNGRYFLNDLAFEQQIKDMSDRQLLEFTARQTYDVSILATTNAKKISTLEHRDKKFAGAMGGIGGAIGAGIITAINYFTGRG